MSSTTTDCGCSPATEAAGGLTLPRFFAGQLLTEDDLTALTTYVTAKSRLHNRMLHGSGAVCGLDVVCDPCGSDTVTVKPGYALDTCGNDIVVDRAERLGVAGLVRDMRRGLLGTDCGDPCDSDDDLRDYGLCVRYAEKPAEPIAAYPTGDSCGGECTPSRTVESHRFLLAPFEWDAPAANPGTRLVKCLGDPVRFHEIRTRSRRLGLYATPLWDAATNADRPSFGEDDAARFAGNLDDLAGMGDDVPDADTAHLMTERLRALAASVARYDLAGTPDKNVEDRLGEARQAIVTAAAALQQSSEDENVWADPVDRSTVAALLTEAVSRCGPEAPEGWDLERRMLVWGTPLRPVLRAELLADLRRIREWLTVRLETIPDRGDCGLPADVAAVTLPAGTGNDTPADQAGLRALASAARRLTAAVRRLLADCTSRSLIPPCPSGTESAVLLARLTLRGCAVVRICTAVRPVPDPAGDPRLRVARRLAVAVCTAPPEEPGPPAYVQDLLDPGPWDDLQQLLGLLMEMYEEVSGGRS
ncbi:hypothetical protein [Actinoplanes subtropicus]|uniref:hypothetical protein n=1 Tax=Actinoplanes subtropicus TaxID=543632 RepID=UPI000691803B|nr:hypothetical protein [Actinoplanes subtropicus]